MIPGFVLTVPEVRPATAIACARVMPGVGFGSVCSASSWMSFSPVRSSDVTFVPAFPVVGTPALMLDVELRAALGDPVVDEARPDRIGGLARDRVVAVRALEVDLAAHAGEREHRHPAVLAFERPVGPEVAQHVSDLLRCGHSAFPATLCRTALASGRGAFSHRTRAARPHWRDPATSAADPGKEGGTTA